MSKQTTGDITLATEKTPCDIFSQIKDGDSTILKYSLALKEFSFHKKMYQPTEVLALVNITKAVGVNYAYQRIGWTTSPSATTTTYMRCCPIIRRTA